MESLLADEHPATVPIVVKGNGPRLVIYCLYNEAAMEAGTAIDKPDVEPDGWKRLGNRGALRGCRRHLDERHP